MKNRILLKENKAAADSVINAVNENYKNGLHLLKLLAGLGLDIKEVKDWQSIENHFKAEYPTASLDFNLDAKNIREPYMEIYSYYQSHKNKISFEKPTAEQFGEIREKHRLYADTAKQIEAHTLANSIANDLNRLKVLGMGVDSFYVSYLSPVFVGGAGGVIEIYNKNLIDAVERLK
jgi:hypothetical protein